MTREFFCVDCNRPISGRRGSLMLHWFRRGHVPVLGIRVKHPS